MVEDSQMQELREPISLADFLFTSYAQLDSGNYEGALLSLSTVEQILKSTAVNGNTINKDLVITTLHNIAFCFQRYFLHRAGNLQDSIQYIEACIYNLKQRNEQRATPSQVLTDKVSRGKYECKAHLQLCAMYSQLDLHESAYEQAKTAVKLVNNLNHWCLSACLGHMTNHAKILMSTRMKEKDHSQYDLLNSPHYRHFHALVRDCIPVFKFLEGKSNVVPRGNFKGLGVSGMDQITIGDLMMVQVTVIDDVKSAASIESELGAASIIYKVMFTALAHFSMSVELKYLSGLDDTKYSLKEAKYWHLKALKFIKILPFQCRIAEYIHSSYTELYANHNRQIAKNQFRSASMKTIPLLTHNVRLPSRLDTRTPELIIRTKSQLKISKNETRKKKTK